MQYLPPSTSLEMSLRGTIKQLGQAVVLPVMLYCSCSSQGGTNVRLADPVSPPADGQSFSFSFSYRGAPPGGRTLKATGLSGLAETCSVFSDGKAPESFVAYNLTLPGTAHGTYSIAPHDDQQARLEIVSVEGGKVSASRFAVAGQIEYQLGPTDEASWVQGDPAVLKVAAKFEQNSVISVSCEGSQNNQTGEVDSTCSCTHEDGSVRLCKSRHGECCYDFHDANVSIDFKIEATPCALQCAFTDPDLSNYCAELR